MKKEQYEKKLKELENKFKEDKKLIQTEYALSNNTYTKGDIFTDHIGKIMVERIDVTVNFMGIPQCVYFGLELKKDGTPKKSNDKRWAYQCNDISNKIN